MKYIIAVIQPDKLAEVKQELMNSQVYLMTVSEVLGCGRQQGHTKVYRGREEVGHLRKKIRLEIGVNEDFVEPTIAAIVRGAYSGEIGDGKIFVFGLDECIRIRTGERGSEAIG